MISKKAYHIAQDKDVRSHSKDAALSLFRAARSARLAAKRKKSRKSIPLLLAGSFFAVLLALFLFLFFKKGRS